jgi:hypothetical protein
MIEQKNLVKRMNALSVVTSSTKFLKQFLHWELEGFTSVYMTDFFFRFGSQESKFLTDWTAAYVVIIAIKINFS